MRNRLLYIFFLILLSVLDASAQTDTIRYVNAKTGKYANDGKTWDKAKDNVQDAINDLYDYMQRNNLHSGSVYVAAGTYTPSESTGDGASVLSTSFKIYDGIHLYGGFNPDDPEASPDQRVLSTHAAWRDGQKANARVTKDAEIKKTMADHLKAEADSVMGYDFRYATILSGNHNTVMGKFDWNENKKQYDTKFPGNSYHVVWYATRGFCKDEKGNATLYADSLQYGASVDGCVIQDGNAAGRTTTERDLNAFGGGVYMVQHATVSNCVIRRCSASRRGGGVYMDRGGTVRDSYIYQCQTLGLGVTDGYGGGACMENNGAMRHTYISNNVGRIGGGLAILYTPEGHPYAVDSKYRDDDFDAYAAGCIVSNNTATTEAGGVLMYKGCVINHMTIVNNDCTGADITQGTIRYGRSGGLYIYGAATCYNSVAWGNSCTANDSIQYASAAVAASDAIYHIGKVTRPHISYMAFSNYDITDWGNTLRSDCYGLDKKNNVVDKAGNYPVFGQPSTVTGAGGFTYSAMAWKPNSMSFLSLKSIQISTFTTISHFVAKTHISRDLFQDTFNPVSALGAVCIDEDDYEVASVAPVDGSSIEGIPTLFVDPNRVTTATNQKMGASWDAPLMSISQAIADLQAYKTANKYNGKTQVLVKEGTSLTAGPGSYQTDNNGEADLQSAAIHMIDGLLLYGGYPSKLKGTSTEGRNPKDYPSVITGNIIGNWKFNGIHIVSFSNVQDAVIDGFHLEYGNGEMPDSPNYDGNDNPSGYIYRLAFGYGAGIFMGARSVTNKGDLKDMTGNVARNCVIANGFAPFGGGAVFLSGTNTKADGNLQKAELQMVNCVIHNNQVRNKQVGTSKQYRVTAGIIQGTGNAKIEMDHCTIVNNVGNVFSLISYGGGTPSITVNNSAVYTNATDSLGDRAELKSDGSNLAALYYTNGSGVLSGSNNLIDALYEKKGIGSLSKTDFKPIFGITRSDDKTYPRFVNPVRNITFRRNLSDVTLYGGSPDYMPMDMNPMVNAAGKAQISYDYDFTATKARDYGGAPDVGAIENTTLPAKGDVYYVRTTGSDTSNDGLSWATAFATIGHALTAAKTEKKDVWVAQGVYKENLTMQDGVNVYGGFKSYGNPGKREGERDISNLKGDFITVIDGQLKDRVLTQNSSFSNKTMWEGLTIQNGNNLIGTVSADTQISSSSTNTFTTNWSKGKGTYGTRKTTTITRNYTRQYTITYRQSSTTWWRTTWTTTGTGNAYGSGAYLQNNATLKNCLIRYNRFFQSIPVSIVVVEAPTSTYHIVTETKASADAAVTTTTKDSTTTVPYLQYQLPSTANVDALADDLKKGGGGAYLGSGAVLENSIIRNNEGRVFSQNSSRMTGAGVRSDGGQVVNSLIVENFAYGGNCLGGAMFLGSKSLIYNSTIAYNYVYGITQSGVPCAPAVWDDAVKGSASDFSTKCSQFYNTVFWANIGYGSTGENFNQVCRGSYRDAIGKTGHMFNCYHSVPCVVYGNAGVNSAGTEITDTTLIYDTKTFSTTKAAIDNGVTNVNTNKYYNSCRAKDLFNESQYNYPTADESSDTQISSIETDNPYSINRSSDLAKYCINMGDAEKGDLLKTNFGITQDIAGADRIQDCQIDKGAYEYNGASEIKPTEGKEKHRVYSTVSDMTGTEKEFDVATYFVSQNGGGVANASDAKNAACDTKLQQVLDAAGRYKYEHPLAHVIVKLAAVAGGGYEPTRTTDYDTNLDENPRNFSLQIPRGVEVQGGWDDGFTTRAPLNNKTLLKGSFSYGTGTSTAYHVVTFTDYVFDANGKRIVKSNDADGQPVYQLLSDVVKSYKATWEKTPGDTSSRARASMAAS
jgi:hypothetical protein